MFIEPRFQDKYSLNPEMVRQGRKCNNRKSNNQDISLDKSYHVIEKSPPPRVATKKAANPREKPVAEVVCQARGRRTNRMLGVQINHVEED